MDRHCFIRHTPNYGYNSSGFTLLELMLSLAMMGIVLLIIFSALRIGTRAWEKGEKDVEVQQRQRAVFDLLQKQIASACLYEIKTTDDTYYFKGSETDIQFVSRNPIAPGSRSGIVYVNYTVSRGNADENMSLMLYERDMIFMKEEDFGGDAEENSLRLISGFKNLRFEYLKMDKDSSETSWQGAWNSSDDNEEMPLAVKMTFEGADDALCLVVPIRCREE
ncbi:MAG: prepilin-type N-terminal cleavage/methylation domain-containing protein [Deltaproteobacteria bacterium]|nr:prepilin-type N-terminal cleavage/methylation domain-containing protein [Deltaproteobacteria bacterium]